MNIYMHQWLVDLVKGVAEKIIGDESDEKEI